MKKFFIGLGIFLIVVWCIALTLTIVCGIMASIHDQSIKAEFFDWLHFISNILKNGWFKIKGWIGL